MAGRENWIRDERFNVHYVLPIVTDDDGERRSVWPEKWPLDELEAIEHTRSYAKNFLNSPMGADGDYWQMDDFEEAPDSILAGVTHEVISVDPAVTSKDSSDATAIAAVGWGRTLGKCVVYEARAIRVGPDDIRLAVLTAIESALSRGHVVIVIVEAEQGGELWHRILHDLPVKVKTYRTGGVPKHVRAADALDHYNRHRVFHVRRGPGVRDAETEMIAFPRGKHDDRVDAVGAGVRYFLSRKPKSKRPIATAQSYA